MRFSSKAELLSDIESEHARLVALINSIPARRRRETGVWGDGWTVHDLIAHLLEWHSMFLRWYADGHAGRTPDLPAPGYKWNQLPALNRGIWRKHHSRATAVVMQEFEASYCEILGLVANLSTGALMEPGYFSWTGKHPLATYLAPNTGSHYRFATRVLRRWLRQQATEPTIHKATPRRRPTSACSRRRPAGS